MEIIIVIAIIIASTSYAINRFVRTIKSRNCACNTCPGCALKEQMLKNEGNPCHDCKKTTKKFCQTKKNDYLCIRKQRMVPWMSGLVNGLQNRLRRFESARHLQKES